MLTNYSNTAGAQADAVTRGLAKFVVRLPSQEPAPDDISFSPATGKVLQTAQKISKEKVCHVLPPARGCS